MEILGRTLGATRDLVRGPTGRSNDIAQRLSPRKARRSEPALSSRNSLARGRRAQTIAERRLACIARFVAQLLLDADELIVLGDAVGARQRARLDLAGIGGDRDIGDGVVLRLARAMRNYGRVARALSHCHGLERFRQRADLVDLDQDRVGNLLANALRQAIGV